MLKITIPGREQFKPDTQEFITTKEITITLEHSLISLSKWESKWHKPFLSRGSDITTEELIDYIRCMTITPNVDPVVYYSLTQKEIDKINDYIADPMTATTFRNVDQKHSREIITSEIIYYWMIASGIPMECEKWHLSRLLTLIRVVNIKSQPPKKMSKKETAARNAALNRQRLKSHKHR